MDEKKSFHTVTQTWSDNIEKVIKHIGESCVGYKWMHIFAAKRANTKYNYFMYCLIFLGPIAGILSSISVEDNNDSTILSILVIVLSFFSGVLSAITKYSKFEQKALTHKDIAAKYASLEGNIRRQLSLYREERVNAGLYLEWVSVSFDDLFSSASLMSQDIHNKWLEYAKINNITTSIEYGKTIEIQNTNVENCNEKEKENHLEIVVQGKDTLKREKNNEFYKYTDSNMQYELKRMQNHIADK